MAMNLPWRSMTDEQLVACCRQRPIEGAWEQFGERYGCHLVAVVFVIWFGYINRPIPWYGPFALACLYFFAVLLALFFVFILPACVRIAPYSRELDRRHTQSSFPREVRKARRLFEGADPPDWIILLHSEPWGWTWTRLTLYESPPHGLREHRSGPIFGPIRDPEYNPLSQLVREERPLEEEECRSKLAVLRTLDLDGVVDVEVNAFDIHYSRLAVLRREPRATRKVKFCSVGVLFDPESRQHPTCRLASLIIKLPEELKG
jgi:hypothetical protein